MKNRAFSLYDIEEFLKEAGAERVNERAVVSLEKELEDTVNEMVDEARVYAQYAGRKLIKDTDIDMLNNVGGAGKNAAVAEILHTQKRRRLLRLARGRRSIRIKSTNMAVQRSRF